MLALTFCLMVGTAGLPHILMRYYTVPSVKEARSSVGWSLFFIFLLYFTAPAYATFARNEILTNVVGQSFSALPAWVAAWGKVGLFSVKDMNADGILQLAEITMNTDVIVLATPEIAGLPYVIAGLVAAGGLAAALSTADGLLLTISNSLSRPLLQDSQSEGIHCHEAYHFKGTPRCGALSRHGSQLQDNDYCRTRCMGILARGSRLLPCARHGHMVKENHQDRCNSRHGIGVGVTLYYMIGNRFFGVDWFGVSIYRRPSGDCRLVSLQCGLSRNSRKSG